MATKCMESPTRKLGLLVFALIQIGVMLLAISNESLWIDEFCNAYFATLGSVKELYELLLVPNGSQTPLSFTYSYLWGLFVQPSELGLRLANLPLFVIGQLSLFLALRTYPRKFSYIFLAISALHPMVWQYANEARPYIMMYVGSEMILAYILHIHAERRNGGHVSVLFSAIFTIGSILLFGASLLGVFWVFSACVYVGYFHFQHLGWRYLIGRGNLVLGAVFLAATSLLSLYYLNSLIQGGGASRISSTNVATLIFDAYELLGLSGVGPGRLDLRESGVGSLGPYWIWLIPATAIILATLASGLRQATRQLGSGSTTMLVVTLGLLPMAIVIFSGFAMHWRVLGRHLIAELPLLNLLSSLGLAKLLEKGAERGWTVRSMIAVAFFAALIYSSLSLRFADRHRKDDYRAAAAIAQQEISKGHRVWWAADSLGARYYGLPGEFDFIGAITGMFKPHECVDRLGVQPISGVSGACLQKLSPPDVVLFSKPETFDQKGAISAYLIARNYENAQTLPAFTVWHRRR